jgi:hypothetical protein
MLAFSCVVPLCVEMFCVKRNFLPVICVQNHIELDSFAESAGVGQNSKPLHDQVKHKCRVHEKKQLKYVQG